MNDTLKTGGFEERLLPMLMSATSSQKSRSRRRRSVMGALLAAALGTGAVFVGTAVGGGETVSVDGSEALRDPRAVERALAAEGIDATILIVPLPAGTDDYWNGRWYSLYLDEATDISQAELDHLYFQVGRGNGTEEIVTPYGTIGADQVTMLELPKDLPGHITLLVGQTVPASHPTVAAYDSMNELSPVGSLFCSGLDPNDPIAVGNALEGRGYSVTWTLESGNEGQAVSGPPAGTVVTWVWTTGPGTADVRLAPQGRDASIYQAAEGTYLPSEDPPWQPPC